MLEELLATESPTADLRSDLAAGLLLRGEARGSGLDLVRALDLTEALDPEEGPGSEALFNRALACEHVLGKAFCRDDWRLAASRETPDGGWAQEIHQHLEASKEATAEESWQSSVASLFTAVEVDDTGSIRAIVDGNRTATRLLIEETILANWGHAILDGRFQDAVRELFRAETLAHFLAEYTGDPMLMQTTTALRAAEADSPRLQELARGHRDYGDAVKLDRTGEPGGGALYESARNALRDAGSPFRAWAEIGVVISTLRKVSGFNGLSEQELEETLEALLGEAHEGGYGALMGRVLWLRALHHQDRGHPLRMLTSYQASLKAFEVLGEKESVVNVAARLADALAFMGASSEAWPWRHRALQGLPRLVRAERSHYVLGSTAIAATNEGLLDAALRLQKAALEPARRDPRRLNTPIALRALAEIHLARGETEAAQVALESAREHLDALRIEAQSEGPVDSRTDSRIEEIAGDLHLPQAPALAAEHYRRAIGWLGGTSDRLPALYLKLSRALSNLNDSDGAEVNLRAAMSYVQNQWRSIFQQRQRGHQEKELEGYFLSSREIFEELLSLLAASGHGEEAYEILEQYRARELLALTGVFISAPPLPMSARDVQRSLPPESTLVAYEVLADQVLVWTLPSDGRQMRMTSLPVSRSRLRTLILGFQDDVQTHKGESDLRGTLQELHQLLLAPLRHDFQDQELLIVVPDEDLSLLPFSALLDFETDRYLVQDHPVAVAPSGTLFAFSRQRDAELAKGPRGGALLVGNPAAPEVEGEPLPPLPRAADEVRRLAQFYPEALLLDGLDATRDRFLEEYARHEVVHFAGHAVISVLALAASPGTKGTGALSSAELLQQPVLRTQASRTRLLVLAACTSLGSGSTPGLELSSFARPFLGNGVPALVGSLWDLKDGASEDLMYAFHGFLTSEPDAVRALQKAQLWQMEDGGPSRPHLRIWAAFQLVGFTTTQRGESR